MHPSLATVYLEDVLARFRGMKALADKAMARLDDEDFFRTLDAESNSVALLVKHLAGSTRSRWTDFLETDGEKPDRHRDREFILEPDDTRAALQQYWEAAWKLLFDAVGALSTEALTKTTPIRGEPHTVVSAISRQFFHSAYHVGQIVQLAKHYQAATWTSLTIPRGESEVFNAKMRAAYTEKPQP